MTHQTPEDDPNTPWTEFVPLDVEPSEHAPQARYVNSRYNVLVFAGQDATLGEYVHLSIRDHDCSARHDWRDLQRIKNELVGAEYDGVELYPAESRLVDTANAFHVYVFKDWHVPIGFTMRLVMEGRPSRRCTVAQRPFEVRPPDCLRFVQIDGEERKGESSDAA